MMFEHETGLFRPDNNDDVNSVSMERCWFESTRLDVIKWILQKRALFGYHYRTAYLSMIYLDRFLSRMRISDGKLLKIQILSIACLSLAAKMEECEARPLRDYTIEGYQFLESSIERMELIVLNTLEWRMSCVTPFSFSNYFAAKLYGESSDRELLIRANELILAIMKEIDVAKHRPSIIAAAAVLAAYDNGLTKAALETKMDAVPSWGLFEKETTVCFYRLLQEISEFKTPESFVSHDSTTIDIVDDSTNTSRGIKRRLSFDTDDQHCPPMKTPRSYKE
ncbi:hypothetical protein C2S52_021374 [Perilla frutescens var. hirtella]|nr:hypothetical protein C2S52_021374 [Perilla frutescens var. hirtella]